MSCDQDTLKHGLADSSVMIVLRSSPRNIRTPELRNINLGFDFKTRIFLHDPKGGLPRMSATPATLRQRQLGGAGNAVDNAVADLFNRSAKIVNRRKCAAHV